MSELALQLIEENKRTKDTFLDLGKCGLEFELPKELLGCVWLERLNLGVSYYDASLNTWLKSKNKESWNIFKGNELAFLKHLPRLQSLDLSTNKIQDIQFLQNLPQLKSLDLTNSQIQNYNFLESLTQLLRLDLSDNRIKNIDFLKNLTQLQKLYLTDNQIQDCSFLKNLTQLKLLDLSTNKIEDCSFLDNLAQLKTLDLRSNNIHDIKPTLPLLKKGVEVTLYNFVNAGIILSENPILNPPMEIVKQGREAILRYFERIEQEGYDFIFEAKLTLVGDGGSGKTSLQRKISDDNAELPTGNDRTRGIKVNDWEFIDANQKTYTSHIWDFGGQDVYYPVHRFFLTENSVYVLMASTRYSVHNFEYWIPTIYQFGGCSPIILVQNCDNGNQKDWADIKAFYGIPEYNLKSVYKIDLSSPDNSGLKNLKGFIQQQISELPQIGKPVPKSWVKLREKLIERAKTNDYMSFEKFLDLCLETDKNAFNDSIDVEDLARFLHDLGIILWYHNKDLLRNIIILRPEWAMTAVYRIIDDTIIQAQNGIIHQSDFNRIWGEETYRAKIGELKLMLQVFKIGFPKKHQKQDYILPARLNPIPDNKLWPNNENYLKLEYHFDFMPRGIVNQLSADLSNNILSDENVWSDAVMLKLDNNLAQVVEETHKKKILIKAKGRDARDLIVLIKSSITNIISEYRGVVPLLRVPCYCAKCQTLDEPTVFKYEKLVGWLNDGKVNVSCDESETKLPISQLLYSVGLEKIASEKEIQNQAKTLEKEAKTTTKKVFVTYCWSDKDGKNDEAHQIKVQEFVSTLCATPHDFDATFDKSINERSTATDFKQMMEKNIKKNDKVIVVLSEGYAAKAYDSESSVEFEYSLIRKEIEKHPNKYILVTFSDRNKEIYPLLFEDRDTIDLSVSNPLEMDRLLKKLIS